MTKKLWINKTCAAILLFTFLIMGCQKEEKSAVNSLKINFQEGDLPSIHPHDLMIYLRGISIAKHLFEGLTRVDAQGKAVLAGAKSVDVSPDGLHYTFVLRDNKWSDGSPVTALHYEAAWKEALSPQSSCSRAHLLYPLKNGEAAKKGTVPLSDIGVKALNDKTLSIDLAHPCPYFLELLSQPICMPLFNAKEKQPTRFNGPFQMGQWVRNHSIRLDQNPHFWNLKKVSLKEIDIFMVQDTPTAFTLFEKKKMDWIGLPLCPLSTEMVDHLKRSGALNSHPIDRAFWLFLNTKHPGLASSSIRKALSLAIDRSQITQHILIGGEPLSKPLPENLLSAPAVSQENRLRENMAEASHCFEQGLKELGFTKETFPPLVITYSQQANRKQFAEYIQQAWTKGLGIQVQLEPQEWNLLRTNLEKGQYMVSGCFEAAYYKDPMEILERLATLNPSNFSQWTHPLFGAKIASAIDEKNTQRRNALMGEAEAILAEHMPFIPICSDRFLFAHTPNLKGYAFDYVGAIDFSYASFKTQE